MISNLVLSVCRRPRLSFTVSCFWSRSDQSKIFRCFSADVTTWRLERPSFDIRKTEDKHLSKVKPFYTQKYQQQFESARDNPESFWAEAAQEISWYKQWDRVLDNKNPPFSKWFQGGLLNVCHNAVDRHVEAGLGDRLAIIHDSPVTNTVRFITYKQLQDQVSSLAGTFAQWNIRRGDRVVIYMPMIPEAIIAMLACARIGAVHSVVFGGFAARELALRMNHTEPKLVISASYGVEPNKLIEYKPILEEAIHLCEHKPQKCIIYNRPEMKPVSLKPELDVCWTDAISTGKTHDSIPIEATAPLYILYTSGTTGTPKAVVRPAGGHAVNLHWTLKYVYGMNSGDTWWAASDLGWVVGHSYICYGPLISGLTTVVFEGKPVGTPDAGTYFRVIRDHHVRGMFTAPTALRAIRKEDPDVFIGKLYNTSCLQYLFVAGEHCDYETLEWARDRLKVPVLDNWWQTESGSPMTATCVGLGNNLYPPQEVSGMPVPGWDVQVVHEEKQSPAKPGELGRILVKLPLPPGSFSNLYKNEEKFKDLYFTKYPGYYDTMDAGMIDEYGYISVLSREDDVINVAGHRLSTSALEEAIMTHPDIVECAVVGVPDALKGEIPLGLYVMKNGTKKASTDITEELIALVRQLVGPVAAFRLAVPVKLLPKTRSGKIARKSISDMAKNKEIEIPTTIEDPSVYENIKEILNRLGFCSGCC